MTREEKQKIFEPLSRNFETENIKAYFMDMVAEIKGLLIVIGAVTGFIALTIAIYSFLTDGNLYSSESEYDETKKRLKKLTKRFLIICIISMSIQAILPSEETSAKMIISSRYTW